MKNRTLSLSLFFITAFITAQNAHADTGVTGHRDDTANTVTVTGTTADEIIITLEIDLADASCAVDVVDSAEAVLFEDESVDCRADLAALMTDAAAVSNAGMAELVRMTGVALSRNGRREAEVSTGTMTAMDPSSHTQDMVQSTSTSSGTTASKAPTQIITPEKFEAPTTYYKAETKTSAQIDVKAPIVIKSKTTTSTKTQADGKTLTPVEVKAPAKTEMQAPTAVKVSVTPSKTQVKTEVKTQASSKTQILKMTPINK
jgi:hypothetical protein